MNSTIYTVSPITSPVANSTWYVGNSYNVTWDPTMPVFSDTDCSFSKGFDIEITKKFVSNATETMVEHYKSIQVSTESYSLNVTEESWNVSSSNYDDFIYKIYLVPAGLWPGSEDRTFKNNDTSTRNCSIPIPIHVLPASKAPASTTTQNKDSSASIDTASPTKTESGSSGKKYLNTIAYTAMAAMAALAVVAQ